MSRTFLIKTEKRIDFRKTYDILRYDRSVNAIEKSDTLVYFYGPGLSTRGVDVSLEKYGYEVRITTMSNRSDLSIALRLIRIISETTNGKVYDEDDNELTGPNYLAEEYIKTSFINDMKIIFSLVNDQGSTIEFPGPTRSVFIGKKVLKQNLNYVKRIKTTAYNIDSIFMEVLYGLPDFTEGSIMAAEAKDNDKLIKLKLVSPNESYIIQNYDYLIIGDSEESKTNDIIMIDQEILETIMPEDWYFVDECTIIAKKMSEVKWNTFREECKRINCYNDFQKKAK
jgi:hypothetical protein